MCIVMKAKLVTNVGEAGYLFVSVGNLSSECQQVKSGTLLGTAFSVILVRDAIPQSAYEHETSFPPFVEHETDCTKHLDFVCKFYDETNIDTSSKYPSLSEFEFLSSTDPSVDGLSEHEVKKRTILNLMAPIPGHEAQLDEVQKLWGATTRTTLDKFLHDFDDLFMKHKAAIGKYKITKHPVDVEPDQLPIVKGHDECPLKKLNERTKKTAISWRLA